MRDEAIIDERRILMMHLQEMSIELAKANLSVMMATSAGDFAAAVDKTHRRIAEANECLTSMRNHICQSWRASQYP